MDDIEEVINEMKNSSASGPSGIDGNYVKSLPKKELDIFKKICLEAFNQMLSDPQKMS